MLNILYNGIVYKLNDYENHRTDTNYEDSLVSKMFVFQLVNSYAALTYVSFVKMFIGVLCSFNNCIGDVATTLSTVFLTRLLTQVILDVFVKKVRFVVVVVVVCLLLLYYYSPHSSLSRPPLLS